MYGMYLSAAGMANEQARQDLIANNLANVETTAFKRIFSVFKERDPHPDSDGPLAEMTGGRWMLPTRLDMSQGGLEQTGGPLDCALVGEGFLVVDDAGQTRLTRDGRLAVNSTGELTLESDPRTRVLDADGQPIQLGEIPIDEMRIDKNGVLRDTATGEPVATLQIAAAEQVHPIGGNLYAFGGALTPAQGVEVRGGYVERSNVDPTVEMTRLIEAGRLLEANANMIRYQDTALGKLIEAGRVG